MRAISKKERAINLRVVERKSVPEIEKILGCPRSTIRFWLWGYPLTADERRCRLRIAQANGREARKATWAKKKAAIEAEARKRFKRVCRDKFFWLGLGLYMGEGGKTDSIVLSNLDVQLLKIFVVWCRRYLKTPLFSGRIFTHDDIRYPKFCREVGAELKVPVKWAKHPIKKRGCSDQGYLRPYGVISILVLKSPNAFATVSTWIKCANHKFLPA